MLNDRQQGKRIVLVPTMGNLHPGHLSLLQCPDRQKNRLVVSIFVNPSQFGEGEDFDDYPRTLDSDLAFLAEFGADYVFCPTVATIYPPDQLGFYVMPPPDLSDILEGLHRPGHFQGVLTVVLKLMQIVQPDVAIFGKKDYQQWRLIENMVDYFNLPIKVMGYETVRAEDGLALSSRNGYLSQLHRLQAPQLYKQLQAAAKELKKEPLTMKQCREIEQYAVACLKEQGWAPDYFKIKERKRLSEPQTGEQNLVIVAAAKLGTTRLIDNIEFVI